MQAKSLQSCPTLCDPMDRQQPTRLLCPWDSPAKNTGVVAISFSNLIAKSHLTLWNPMDHSPPGPSVQVISQARIPEWVAISFPVAYIRNPKIDTDKLIDRTETESQT